jgi:hypothetical protein
VISTRRNRLDGLDRSATPTPDEPCDTIVPGSLPPAPARVVTTEQVQRAVLQLRERSGQSAAEQVRAVLRAFDLTVVPSAQSD